MKIRYEVIRVDEFATMPVQRYVFSTLEDAEKTVEIWTGSTDPGIHYHILKRYEKE